MATFSVTEGVTTFLAPPEGYEVDVKNPQHQNKIDLYLTFGLLGSLAFVCLMQRLYTKKVLAGGLEVDDCMPGPPKQQWRLDDIKAYQPLSDLITLAWLVSVVMQAVQTWSISVGGLCHHAWEMPIAVFEKHMISSYIAAPLFIICNGLSKTSLLAFYFRISDQRWFQNSIWASIAMVISYTVIITALLLFGCRPLHAAWDPYIIITGQTCVDQASLYIAIAVANIVSDVVLFLIPIPTVLGLSMPLSQKVGATLMFGVGSVTVATSIIRMVYLPSLLGAADIPWVAAPANVWVFVEVDLFIICGCMPTVRRFLRRFAPKWLGSWGSSSSDSNTYQLSAIKMNDRKDAQVSGRGDVEAIDLPNKCKKEGRVQESPSNIESPMALRENKTEPLTQDNSSEEAILGASVITYTRAFEVRFSTVPANS